MTLWMVVRISLQALLRNKLRTSLTMLGIIIGVTTVITMLAIGTGASRSIQDAIANLGTNALMIFPGSSSSGGVHSGAFGASSLTVDDAKAIEAECPAVGEISPVASVNCQIVYQDQNWNTMVSGVGVGQQRIRNWKMVRGRFLLEDDVRSSAKVCVIGKIVADNLFRGEDPVDKFVRIKGLPVRVVGELFPKGDSAFGSSQDDVIMVPYTTCMSKLQRASSLRFILASARSEADVERAKEQISELLMERHKIPIDAEPDFTVRTQSEFSETASQGTKIFTMLIAGIASVSLLVGGIGIMNIMMVSVTERVREIGIRMALGAKRRDILRQFLVESMVLSLLGGGLGVVLGYALAQGAAQLSAWPAIVTTESVLLAFGFSLGVGVFFGFYPAFKASRLDPIQALRSE